MKLSSAPSGAALRESQNINKSLSALGDVVNALSLNYKHIPYRNSKLTFLLQNVLRENCKILMFINIVPIPVQEFVEESINSILFAQRCKTVDLGKEKKKKITHKLRDVF